MSNKLSFDFLEICDLNALLKYNRKKQLRCQKSTFLLKFKKEINIIASKHLEKGTLKPNEAKNRFAFPKIHHIYYETNKKKHDGKTSANNDFHLL